MVIFAIHLCKYSYFKQIVIVYFFDFEFENIFPQYLDSVSFKIFRHYLNFNR